MVYHVAHTALSPLENQEADAVSKVKAMSSHGPIETAHWIYIKSGNREANTGRKIAKADGIPVKYSDI